MNNIKSAIAKEMENYFGGDSKRIQHAYEVTEYVEKIWQLEGGDYPVVIAAGLLHDIGIPLAEKKYGSSSGKYQEVEGPPIAQEILVRLNFRPEQIEEVCQIIAHHHSPGKSESQNYKILYDADWLKNIRDEFDIKDKTKIEKIIKKVFLTPSGRELAQKIYLTNEIPNE